MRWICSFFLLLLFSYQLFSEEKTKPNTLSQKEISQGWILLFDGETMFGWIPDYRPSSTTRWGKQDVLVDQGSLVLSCPTKETKETMAYVSTEFHSFEMVFQCYREGESKSRFGLQIINYPESGGEGYNWSGKQFDVIAPKPNEWTTVRVKAYSDEMGQYCYQIQDGEVIKTRADPKVSQNYRSRFAIQVDPGGKIAIRNLRLKPLDTKTIFNEKDLTGWKIFPGERYKSKYTVTSEGFLNVRNGPGDLQTEGKYDDFVLQLECISNGNALNSGIFFRCIDGQYQNGYEAQIHNGFNDNDRTKPKDGGTGAIYRRVQARKVVPNDREWFTMTLVAHGTHLATWVNGYQVADWVDTRPADENPRKGSKIGKGHLSIQGHDSTTDLSFRSIRLAELKK